MPATVTFKPLYSSRTTARIAVALSILVVAALVNVARAQPPKLQRLGGGRFMVETVRQLPAGRLNTLRITGPASLWGHVVVNTHASDSVRVEMARIFKVKSQELAEEFERAVLADIAETDTILHVDLRTRRSIPWEGTQNSAGIDLSVLVPRNWNLDVDTKYFEYDLAGPFRSVAITSKYGRVKLEHVTERVSVNGAYTAIQMTDVRGRIEAVTRHSTIDLRDAIPAPDQPARLSNRYGAISVEKLVGALIAESESAPIILSDLALVGSETVLENANASIEASIREFGDARLQVRNRNGPVMLKVPSRLSARLNLATDLAGVIEVKGLLVQTHPSQLDNGRLEGVCGAGRGQIDVEVSGHGQIVVEAE